MKTSQKLARQREIVRLIRAQTIRTQAELADALRERAFPVSQPTLSKDIAELGLIKVPLPDSGYRYQLPTEGGVEHPAGRLQFALREFLFSWEAAGQLIVMKTVAGHAAGVAWALDTEKWSDILGTIAGEDTVLVVCRTPADADHVLRQLQQVLEG
ncbi:MAG TPA: arginine repressor [Candidatus Latescibacteria bacterium]|nr:arginine repressor [Candidatus Latescibacterota bacterium]